MVADLGGIKIGRGEKLVFISGPCVIESYENAFETAKFLKDLSSKLDIQIIFKSSFDKANRTSVDSFRGPGLEKGLEILSAIKKELDIKILSDVHRISEVEAAAEVLDVIQIPAFLCRQTDFLIEAAKTGRPINIKKGQFLAPGDMGNVIKKVKTTGNENVTITERGTSFGYNNLVVDFRGFPMMAQTQCPIIFDATHSVQLPGGGGSVSGGDRELAPVLAKAAIAAGADGIFVEVHPDPDNAKCDGPNSLKLETLPELFAKLVEIHGAAAD